MSLVINGNTVESGNSNDILGNPWKSLVAASALATKYKLTLKAGDIVLAGAATSAHFIKEHNEISAEVAKLETVFFRMLP
jgi:2-keto-4-pentenoate hydratase